MRLSSKLSRYSSHSVPGEMRSWTRPSLHSLSSRWRLARCFGWLLGSREGAGAKQTVDSLRLQLDEVVKERDDNRGAASATCGAERRRRPSAATSTSGSKALRSRRADSASSGSAQLLEIASKLARRARKRFRATRQSEKLTGRAQPVERRSSAMRRSFSRRERARRPLCRPSRSGGAGPDGAGQVRDETRASSTRCALAQGARALGREEPCATSLIRLAWSNMSISRPKSRSRATKADCGPTSIVNLPTAAS